MKKNNIVIWDRFDYMLTDAGYTEERFPGIAIQGLQTMDEDAAVKTMKGEEAERDECSKPG